MELTQFAQLLNVHRTETINVPKSHRPKLSVRFGWPLATPQIMAIGIHRPCTLAVNLLFMYLLNSAFPIAVSTFPASDLHSYSYTLVCVILVKRI